MSQAQEATIAAGKAAPPGAVVVATLTGVDLQQWVLIATLFYIALQAGYLCWKWLRDWKDEREEDERERRERDAA